MKQDRLDKNQQERVAKRYHNHPLLCACQQAFLNYQASMLHLMFSPVEVFVEAIRVIDDLFDEDTDIENYIQNMWENLLIRYKLWPVVARNEEEYQTAVSSVIYVVAVTLSTHNDLYYKEDIKDALLSVVDNHKSIVKQEEDKVIVTLSKYANEIKLWFETYSQSKDYLSDEIDDVANDKIPNSMSLDNNKGNKKEFSPTTATFQKTGTVLDAHITLLYQQLIKDKWIHKLTNPDDFLELFSGKPSSITIIWLKAKGVLYDMIKMLINEEFIVCPEGYGFLEIASSHFVDQNDNYLTNLNSGYSGKRIQTKILYLKTIMETNIVL